MRCTVISSGLLGCATCTSSSTLSISTSNSGEEVAVGEDPGIAVSGLT